jgi:hypothetical protein
MKNILYLGMAWDIMLPMLAEPDFDTLYVLNQIDYAYGSWDHHMKTILSILKDGSDENVMSSKNPSKFQKQYYNENGSKSLRVHRLSGTSKILSDNVKELDRNDFQELSDYPKIEVYDYKSSKFNPNKAWRISFLYENKIRNLVYYATSFLSEWPSEIKNIQSIFWPGSYEWNDLRLEKSKIIRNMIETRSTLPLSIYTQENENENFPIHLHFYTGSERDGMNINKLVLLNFQKNKEGIPWWGVKYKAGKNLYL